MISNLNDKRKPVSTGFCNYVWNYTGPHSEVYFQKKGFSRNFVLNREKAKSSSLADGFVLESDIAMASIWVHSESILIFTFSSDKGQSSQVCITVGCVPPIVDRIPACTVQRTLILVAQLRVSFKDPEMTQLHRHVYSESILTLPQLRCATKIKNSLSCSCFAQCKRIIRFIYIKAKAIFSVIFVAAVVALM